MCEEKTAEEPSHENLQKIETVKANMKENMTIFCEGVNHSFPCNMVRKR